MTETLLPMKLTKTLRVSIGDAAILEAAARDLKISEAEVMRLAIRRFAFCDGENGLKAGTVAQLRRLCGGLAIGSITIPEDLYSAGLPSGPPAVVIASDAPIVLTTDTTGKVTDAE